LRGFFAFGAMAIETALPAMGRSSLDVAGFLWCARLIGRVHMGSDLRRFIVALELFDACFRELSTRLTPC